jgi:hypothetical protein
MRPSGFSPEAINSAREIQPLLLSSNPFSPSHEGHQDGLLLVLSRREKMEGNAQFSRILATFPFCKKCKKSFRPFLLQGRRRPFPPPTGLLPPSPPPPGQAKRENES